MRGTKGQARIPETTLRDPMIIEPGRQNPAAVAGRVRKHAGDILLNKHWFDVFSNANVETVLGVLAPRVVVVYGVAQDFCNRYAIEGLLTRHPEIRLYAVSERDEADRP